MATPDAVLAAALEAVALGAECAAEDCSERLEVYADDRLYDLVHHAQTHYAAIAAALLACHEREKVWQADFERRLAAAEKDNAAYRAEIRDYRAALARRDHPTAEPEE